MGHSFGMFSKRSCIQMTQRMIFLVHRFESLRPYPFWVELCNSCLTTVERNVFNDIVNLTQAIFNSSIDLLLNVLAFDEV
jgi:hypothetical protein